MKKAWKKVAFVFLPFIIGILLGISLVISNSDGGWSGKFLTPLGLNPEVSAAKVPSIKPVMGFLPYWNLDTAEINYHLIDWLIYFSVGLDGNGNVIKSDGKNIDMGWYRLQGDRLEEIWDRAKKNEVKVALAITVFPVPKTGMPKG